MSFLEKNLFKSAFDKDGNVQFVFNHTQSNHISKLSSQMPINPDYNFLPNSDGIQKPLQLNTYNNINMYLQDHVGLTRSHDAYMRYDENTIPQVA